jgi:hypothetical protein
MATIDVDKAKVNRMVTQILKHFHGSGAHPGEIVLALGESLGRVIAAVGEMSKNEMVQRELVDLAIKQMTNAILVSRGEEVPSSSLVIPVNRIQH